MRLTTNGAFAPKKPIDAAGAVAYVADRAAEARDYGDRALYRAEALQGVLGRLIGAMITNGQLRTEQVSEIFNYDVIAEPDA
jgi:hypothetical protein